MLKLICLLAEEVEWFESNVKQPPVHRMRLTVVKVIQTIGKQKWMRPRTRLILELL